MAQTFSFDPHTKRWVANGDAKVGERRIGFWIPVLASSVFVAATLTATGFLWVTAHPVATKAPHAPKLGVGLALSTSDSTSSLRDLVRPVLSGMRFGAYAGEAAEVAGLGTSGTDVLADPTVYRKYRASVKRAYGLDLEDMNYFGIGQPGWTVRIAPFAKWLMLAGQYGDVTVAIEPVGVQKYGVFEDGPDMKQLRDAFQQAGQAGITVWVRFASEANLGNSPYSAVGHDGALRFFQSAQWFKAYMPSNVRMVFSPLINTAVEPDRMQHETIRWMFMGDDTLADRSLPWDCIGGTLYRTKHPLVPIYQSYYDRLSSLNTSLPFQLCEIGAPYQRKKEVIRFLRKALNQTWPRLKKINLFARDINRIADPDGQFGFMNPDSRAAAIKESNETHQPMFVESYLREFFLGQLTGTL